jgi:hypothetical protein
MTLIKKYSDVIFILIMALILVAVNELGYFEKLARFSLVFMLAAYFTGKYVSKWQRNIKA